MQERIARYIKIFSAFAFLLVLVAVAWPLYAYHYEAFVTEVGKNLYLHELTDHYSHSSQGYKYFWLARWVALLIVLLWSLVVYRITVGNKSIIGGRGDRIFDALARSVVSNYLFVKNLKPAIKHSLGTIILIQSGVFLFFLYHLPYHYDEAYTYVFFSGKSILTSLTFYPLPNNHVLHNIISGVFLLLPLNEIVAIRMASYIASIFTTYYFFKLALKLLPAELSIITTSLFTFSFPFVLYATQARGYALLTFFAVLCMYSLVCTAENKSTLKYLCLYSVSSILGFFTIPSFLYCFAVVNVFFLLHFILRFELKNSFRFVVSNLVIFGVTILLYIPLIIRNSWKALTANNGVIKRDIQYIKGNMKSHLQDVYEFFMGGSSLSFHWIYLLLTFAIVHFFFRGYINRLTSSMLIVLLLSPVPIMFMHGAIPFPRTWIYLMIPFSLCMGLMLHVVSILAGMGVKKFHVRLPSLQPATFILIVVISVAMLNRFYKRHFETQAIDYVTGRYAEVLKHKLPSVRSYGFFRGDMSFYLSECLNFEYVRHVKGNDWEAVLLTNDSKPTCDMLVLDKTTTDSQLILEDYYLIPDNNPFFLVYLRKGL